MQGLFSESISLNLPDSSISYFPRFLNKKDADVLFHSLKDTTPWQQDTIKVYGKTYQQPRLTALFSTINKTYSYSSIIMQPHKFTKELLEIKEKLESKTAVVFNTCLLNFYRDGNDSNGWHADDEKELGQNPVIASLTLGQERYFHLKHKKDTSLKHKLLLEHGSLLLMEGPTQHHWFHQIAKTKIPIGPRINLTFRVIN